MPLLRAELIEIILVCSLVIVAVSLLLIAYAGWMRVQAARQAGRLRLYRSLIAQALAAQSDARNGYQSALARLRAVGARNRWPELEQALLDCIRSTGTVDAGRRIATDLGILARWRQGLGAAPGRNRRFRRRPDFLTRAKCASNLAVVGDRASWQLLAHALDDPHPDVQRAALRALAELKEPRSAPVLASLLAACSEKPRQAISERSLRAAWGHFPTSQRAELLPLLARSGGRARRLALAMLVQSPVNGGAAPGARRDAPGVEIPRSMLKQIAADPDAEVRARAADLLAIMPDDHAEEMLRRLLDDGEWFVRLHAVRAVAARRSPSGAKWLESMITDPHWRVREAAAQELSQWGSEGVDRLAATFQTTADAYAREQAAEALETSGHASLLNGVSMEGANAAAAAATNGIIRKKS